MMSKKKKIAIISLIVIISFIIIGIVYAFFNDYITLRNTFKMGTVKIDTLNLTLTKENGTVLSGDVKLLEPGDLDTISWTAKNIGTSSALTRHSLEIMWNEKINESDLELLALYPANMKRSAVLEDYANGNGENSKRLQTTVITKGTGDNLRYGIKYQFVGDTINGTDGNDVSSEKNYNITDTGIIDTSISTDDTNKTLDEIAFRLLLSPQTSYLFEGKSITIKVVTEAMQYTEDGSANWQVVDTEELP